VIKKMFSNTDDVVLQTVHIKQGEVLIISKTFAHL
jgi:hypothetical protein